MAATPTSPATGEPKPPRTKGKKSDPRKAHWEPDDLVPHCRLCLTSFTLTTRRHHCRACGQIFCGECSRYYLQLPEEMGYLEPRRTCRTCLQRHSTLNYAQTYDIFGENNKGTTILLMHDAMGNRQQLVYTAEFLAHHEYRVVSFDFPGLGSKPNEKLTMDTALASTKEVIERYCPGRSAVLCGFGMGGYVAMVFASKHPEMVKGMILCNTNFDLSGFSGSIISNMMGAIFKITPRKALWSLILQQYPTANYEKVMRCYLKNVVDYDKWGTCASLLAEPHQGYFREALRSYKGKVIMIIGEEDCKYAESKFGSVLYDGHLAVIKGGHDLMAIDDVTSTEFHQIIDGFLESLPLKEGSTPASPRAGTTSPNASSPPASSSSSSSAPLASTSTTTAPSAAPNDSIPALSSVPAEPVASSSNATS